MSRTQHRSNLHREQQVANSTSSEFEYDKTTHLEVIASLDGADRKQRALDKSTLLSSNVKDNYKEFDRHHPLATILKQWTCGVILFNLMAPIVAIVVSLYGPPMLDRSSNLNYDITSWNIFYFGCTLAWMNAYNLLKEGRNLELLLRNLRQLSLIVAGLQCLTHVILLMSALLHGWINSEELKRPLFSYATFPTLQFASTYLIPVIELLISIEKSISMEDTHRSPSSRQNIHDDHDVLSHITRASREIQDVARMVTSILEQYAPSSVLSASQEGLSSCSIAMPIASTSAITMAMKQATHISSCLQHFAVNNICKENGNSQFPRSNYPPTEEENVDISEVLQSIGDAMEGLCTIYKVPLVVYFADSEWRSINVVSKPAVVRHSIIEILKTTLDAAEPGCTVEMALNVNYLNSPSNDIKHQGDDRVSISIDISLIAQPDNMYKIYHIAAASLIRNQIKELGGSINLSDSPTNRGPTVNITFEARQGVEFDSTVGRGAATPVNEHSTEGVDFDSLENFHNMLKEMKIVLYALNESIFAKHLTSCLSNWNLDITHCSINEISEQENNLLDDEQSRKDIASNLHGHAHIGFTLQPPYLRSANSPYLSLMESKDNAKYNSIAADIIIIDDDIPALKRHILNRQAAVAPDTLLRSRQTGRRVKSGMTNRQDVRYPDLTHQATILYFTSLANYKQVRELIISNVNPWSKHSFALSHIVAIPKPACPRRILTALYTAWNKGSVGPQYTPIATWPPSPLTSNSSYTSQATSQEYLTPPTPHGEMHYSESSFKKHERGMDSPSVRDGENGQYFAFSSILPSSMPNSIKSHSSASSHGSILGTPAGVIVDEGMLFSPGNRNSHQTPRNKDTIKRTVQSPKERSPTLKYRLHDTPQLNALLEDYSSDAPTRTASNGNVIQNEEVVNAVSKTKAKARVDLVSNGLGLLPALQSTGPSIARTIDSSPQRYSTSELDDKIDVTIPPEVASHSISHLEDEIQLNHQDNYGSNTQLPQHLEPPKLSVRANLRRASLKRKKKMAWNSRTSVSPPIHVLIVEDNIINQVILSKWMKNHSIKYAVASNGQEAYDKWKSGGFHLILMDIQLPVMDGITVTKKIRADEKFQKRKMSRNDNPREVARSKSADTVDILESGEHSESEFRSPVIIVALTASSLDSDRQEALAAGCNDFLTKPVSLEWLERKITEWGCMQALIDYEGWRQWRETKRSTEVLSSEQKAETKLDKQEKQSAEPNDRTGFLMRGGSDIKMLQQRSAST